MTPEEGLRMQIEGYRRMTPQQRLAIGFELYQLSRTIVRQGVKTQHPDWDDSRVAAEVARRFRLGAGIP
jgi:Rv0078B-related antitoxin